MSNPGSLPRLHADFVPAVVEALRGVLLRGRAVDLRAAESDKSESAHEALLRTIGPLLEEAQRIVRDVASRFEETADIGEAEIAIADLAALAGMALQERRSFLAHPQPCDHWTFLETCEHSLRSLGKSASVVENALVRYGHLPPRIDRAADLASSLRVRRRYATLRRETGRIAAQRLDVQARLRAASKAISSLLNSDEYLSMRLGDRRELRMLQFRIQSWLSTEHPSETLGERMWEEVTAVMSLLAGINQRSELVAHDAEVLARVSREATGTADVRSLREMAAPLFGLDAALDELLDIRVPEEDEHRRWQQTIARLAMARGLDDFKDDPSGRAVLAFVKRQ